MTMHLTELPHIMDRHVKILLDTDIGTNIDDALCLSWLLANPACDILGITTVTGEAVKRAESADAICRSMGRNVPVFPGAEQPLFIAQRQTTCEQYRFIAPYSLGFTAPAGDTVDFLSRTIRKHPGDITIITIGPLTNIAMLFKKDPGVTSLLGGIVSMCGNYSAGPVKEDSTETNVRLDPHAAEVVFRQSPPHHFCAGIDVTCSLTMDRSRFMRDMHPLLPTPVKRMAEMWFAEREIVTFHDPLAAMIALNPDVCTYERGNVSVMSEDGEQRGRTDWRPDGSGTVEIANHVDRERFFSLYSSTFL